MRDGHRVRIAFCVDNLNIGGTELNAVRTAERLDRSRFDVAVVSLSAGGPLAERYAAAGITVQPFPLKSLYGIHALRSGQALTGWLRRNGIGVLHAHDVYSNLFGVFWARRAGVATIASRRWWAGPSGLHWQWAARAGYRLCTVALANSERVADLLAGEGIAASKIAVVRNFLDEEAFQIPGPEERARRLAGFGLVPGDVVVGIVANLRPIKDHATLFRAFARLKEKWPAVKLLLVGDGSEAGSLKGLATELAIEDRVVFAGRQPNLPNLHHLLDISVLCSLSEGLPNSILEAMAAARPVVATNVGAVADAILDGETGLLTAPSDPVGLADAISSLLRDAQKARRLGEAARRRARLHYTPESSLASLEAIYQRMAGRNAPNAWQEPAAELASVPPA